MHRFSQQQRQLNLVLDVNKAATCSIAGNITDVVDSDITASQSSTMADDAIRARLDQRVDTAVVEIAAYDQIALSEIAALPRGNAIGRLIQCDSFHSGESSSCSPSQ
jgi:hypothetical protein